MTNKLRIHTQIQSRYLVFDSSGRLPFSIVFGLCRKSPADADPRPLLLEVAGSALDVPYALAHGFLTLDERHPKDPNKWTKVDLSRLNEVTPKEAECLSLPSPVNRTENWRHSFTEYQCRIDVNGELASMLELGRWYKIRVVNGDLGIKRWEYSDEKHFIDNDWKPSENSEAVKLVSQSSGGGIATFKVVKSLPWPPIVETRMRLCTSSPSSNLVPAHIKLSSSVALEVSVINTGSGSCSDSITVQTRGRQQFLTPRGPFDIEYDLTKDATRIIDRTPALPPTSSLLVVDSMTGNVVRGIRKPGGCAGLSGYNPNYDPRPKASHLVILKHGTPVTREVDIRALMNGLEDGQYEIRLKPTGYRWWPGELGEEQADNGRVSEHLGRTLGIPLMLESQDKVELHIKDGKIDESI